MKILLCGATAGSNFGDLLFAKMFQDKISEAIGKENVFWYRSFGSFSTFFENYLDNHNKCKLSDIDLMVYISGGYFFGDDRKLKNYIARYLRYCHIGIRCILHKIPYIIIGMEVGPSRNKLMQHLQLYIIKKAQFISVRNTESYDYVRQNIRGDVELSADSALCILDFYIFQSKRNTTGKKQLLLHINSRTGANQQLIDRVIPSLNRLIEEEEYKIILTADQFSNEQKKSLDEVASHINSKDVEKYEYYDPLNLCDLIKSSDLIITTKLHVGIIGSRFGCSVLSFSGHTEKIKRFYHQIGESGRTKGLADLDSNSCYTMLKMYKDKRIAISPELIEQARHNFEVLTKYLK